MWDGRSRIAPARGTAARGGRRCLGVRGDESRSSGKQRNYPPGEALMNVFANLCRCPGEPKGGRRRIVDQWVYRSKSFIVLAAAMTACSSAPGGGGGSTANTAAPGTATPGMLAFPANNAGVDFNTACNGAAGNVWMSAGITGAVTTQTGPDSEASSTGTASALGQPTTVRVVTNFANESTPAQSCFAEFGDNAGLAAGSVYTITSPSPTANPSMGVTPPGAAAGEALNNCTFGSAKFEVLQVGPIASGQPLPFTVAYSESCANDAGTISGCIKAVGP
jgi:hypothetical protein